MSGVCESLPVWLVDSLKLNSRAGLVSRCGLPIRRTSTRRGESMGSVGRLCGAALAVGLVFGLAGAISGCDSGGTKAEYKPIETNILKKLGSANPGPTDAVKAKLSPQVKNKK